MDRSSDLFLQIPLNPRLHFHSGCHLIIKDSKSDVLEVSDRTSFVVVECVLSHDVNEQYILLVDILVVLLHPLCEGNLFIPAQTKIIVVFFNENTVDLAIIELLNGLEKVQGIEILVLYMLYLLVLDFVRHFLEIYFFQERIQIL